MNLGLFSRPFYRGVWEGLSFRFGAVVIWIVHVFVCLTVGDGDPRERFIRDLSRWFDIELRWMVVLELGLKCVSLNCKLGNMLNTPSVPHFFTVTILGRPSHFFTLL